MSTWTEILPHCGRFLSAVAGSLRGMAVVPDLVDLSDYVFGRTIKRLAGLIDDEYRWEPAPGCWNIRLCADGVWRVDWALAPDEPAPLTTIAWRLGHLRQCYGQSRNRMMLGVAPADVGPGPFDWVDARAPGSASEAVAQLSAAHDAWRALLVSLTDSHLAELIGEVGGQYATYTRASYVHHMLDEFVHHAAEVGVLRDLYRARTAAASEPSNVAEAATNGRWERVLAMVDAGRPVDDRHGGATAVHQAVAAGRVDVVRRLVEAGADLAATDERFHATPLGWAELLRQQPVIDYLTEVSS